MYETYWQLNEKPFRNTPDPRFFYLSKEHDEALSRLLYVVREQMGGAILTGEVGSGKTLLSRVLRKELLREHYQPVLIFNPRQSPVSLIKEICFQLDNKRPSLSSKSKLLNHLHDILLKKQEQNKKPIIVLDEAQTIPRVNTFEEIRMLLNFQSDDKFLLTLLLLGQPELKEKIKKIPQFRQRMAVRFHLSALTEKEVREYVEHRMKVAGAQRSIFTEDAFCEIFRFSGGIPRTINNICDLALLVAYGEEAENIDRRRIREIAEDLEEEPLYACSQEG